MTITPGTLESNPGPGVECNISPHHTGMSLTSLLRYPCTLSRHPCLRHSCLSLPECLYPVQERVDGEDTKVCLFPRLESPHVALAHALRTTSGIVPDAPVKWDAKPLEGADPRVGRRLQTRVDARLSCSCSVDVWQGVHWGNRRVGAKRHLGAGVHKLGPRKRAIAAIVVPELVVPVGCVHRIRVNGLQAGGYSQPSEARHALGRHDLEVLDPVSAVRTVSVGRNGSLEGIECLLRRGITQCVYCDLEVEPVCQADNFGQLVCWPDWARRLATRVGLLQKGSARVYYPVRDNLNTDNIEPRRILRAVVTKTGSLVDLRKVSFLGLVDALWASPAQLANVPSPRDA